MGGGEDTLRSRQIAFHEFEDAETNTNASRAYLRPKGIPGEADASLAHDLPCRSYGVRREVAA